MKEFSFYDPFNCINNLRRKLLGYDRGNSVEERKSHEMQCPWCGNKFISSLGKQMPKCPRCGKLLKMNDSVHQLTMPSKPRRIWWW